MHIMSIFQVESKKVNALKKKFEAEFPSKQAYEAYLEATPFQDIVKRFAEVCQLEPVGQPQ